VRLAGCESIARSASSQIVARLLVAASVSLTVWKKLGFAAPPPTE